MVEKHWCMPDETELNIKKIHLIVHILKLRLNKCGRIYLQLCHTIYQTKSTNFVENKEKKFMVGFEPSTSRFTCLYQLS